MAIRDTTGRSNESISAASVVGSSGGGGNNEQITFDPNRILSGIAFHLLDDELALEVDQTSLAALRIRMEHARIRPMISRHDWQRMTDYDRLHWLMRCGNVTVSHHDGIAKLT